MLGKNCIEEFIVLFVNFPIQGNERREVLNQIASEKLILSYPEKKIVGQFSKET